MTLRGYARFKRKLTRYFKKKIKSLSNVHSNSRKSEKLHFDGLLLSNGYQPLNEKVQESYVSWHWRLMQSLKRHWFLVPKMTWGIWWILMQAVTSLKYCTLMCFFCKNVLNQKSTEKLSTITFRRDAQFVLYFKKWHQKFSEFWSNTWKSQNLHFSGLLFTKTYNVGVKKLQRSYVSWHWWVIQSLNKIWFVLWKMT